MKEIVTRTASFQAPGRRSAKVLPGGYPMRATRLPICESIRVFDNQWKNGKIAIFNGLLESEGFPANNSRTWTIAAQEAHIRTDFRPCNGLFIHCTPEK